MEVVHVRNGDVSPSNNEVAVEVIDVSSGMRLYEYGIRTQR